MDSGLAVRMSQPLLQFLTNGSLAVVGDVADTGGDILNPVLTF